MLGALIVVLALTAAGAVAMRAGKAGAPHAGDAPPIALQFAPADVTSVQQKAIARWLPVSGALSPVEQATVKAKVSGDVREIRVREGEAVSAGQVLGRIDTADLEARLVERMGALESARAQLALAEKTRTTNQALLKQNFISQNAFDNVESTFNVARGSLKSAEAQVQLARNALKDAVLVAPIRGHVAKRHVQPGEKVAFDTPIITIVDLRRLELQAMVPAADVPGLALGMPVELAVDGFGERRFDGRVDRINPATESGTRAIVVYVGLVNADGALRSGMYATGRIALSASAPTATLPLTAVRTEAGQTFVWTVEGGRLVRRTVALGRRDDDAGIVEITTALPPGAPVLAARFDNLKDGAPALVREPAAAAARSS
jgi:membrane fusion protein, multidrug efflux system